MDLGLRDKGVLVTGSTSGIGEAIAMELAAEGARVVVHGRREPEAERVVQAIELAGGEASYVLGDLRRDDDADGVATCARERLGSVHILVNNTGTYDFQSTWGTLSTDDWLDRFNVNVGSAIRVTRALLEHMRGLGWGRIVNIGSTDATTPEAELPDYAASKAALANTTLTLARELQGSGVTANTVTPNFVLTDTVINYLRQVAAARGWPDERDLDLPAHAMKELFGGSRGGWGRPCDVAYVVAIVCSTRADWMTATDLRIDGGGA